MTIDTSKKIAIISDIHANLPALRTVLEDIDNRGIETIVCLGDIVGYGPNPNECCAIIRERNIPSLMGNHDKVAIDLEKIEYFNEIARNAILWTNKTLEPDHIAYLSEMPYVRTYEPLTLVHASPCKPKDWNYVLTMGDARTNFECFDQWICFIGHSHQPFAVEQTEQDIECHTVENIPLNKNNRYIVNVGSVGQPRDRDPRSCYVVYDPDEMSLHFRRLEYDIKETQQAIKEAGLDANLALRLERGV